MVVSIPQAVSTVATDNDMVERVWFNYFVSIPQAVSTVATKTITDPITTDCMFQYRKR